MLGSERSVSHIPFCTDRSRSRGGNKLGGRGIQKAHQEIENSRRSPTRNRRGIVGLVER